MAAADVVPEGAVVVDVDEDGEALVARLGLLAGAAAGGPVAAVAGALGGDGLTLAVLPVQGAAKKKVVSLWSRDLSVG